MKKIIIAVVLTVCLIITAGCSKNDKIASPELNERFLMIEDINNGTYFCRVIVDKKTKVMYLFHGDYRKGGLTVMLDADGKPLLYE